MYNVFMIAPEIINQSLEYFSRLDSAELLAKLKSSPEGLLDSEARKRLVLYGKNLIKQEKKHHLILQFLSNFKNPLILILMVVSVISIILGDRFQASIVLVIVVMSVALNFVQEYKANLASEKLKSKLAYTTAIIRNGVKKEIATKNVCLGDIVELNAGDMIPADCRILKSTDVFANQSTITGESFPAEKHAEEQNPKGKNSFELTNILLHGSSIISGTAVVLVIRTGSRTEFGKVALNLSQNVTENEFTKGILSFSLFISKIILVFVLFIFLFTALVKFDFINSLMFSVAIAVGLTPEFLPMIMSVCMSKGSLNMAKKGVIVKRLSSIPTLGSMDVLCTDKTGTLTENKIKLIKYIDLAGNHSEKVLFHSYLNSFFQTGINNIMDEAVLSFKEVDIAGYKKIDEIPFDFKRKRMTVVVEDKNKNHFLITKGAPEEIFKLASNIVNTANLADRYKQLSNEGFRVLAVAIKKQQVIKERYSTSDECDMELIGYLAFLDPPKKDVTRVLRDLENLGIEIKIITGDNELVASRICQEVDLKVKGILLGSEIDEMSEDALLQKVKNTTIFAEFLPEDKTKIILALKKGGFVVGYLGDGINDAPSLKTADVGISVSNAVDIAREMADMVMTARGLNQLKDGVLEGRRTFGNTMKYVMMGISSNFGNMFSVLGAVIFLPFLPMLPIQILLNNLIYETSQVTIPTDNVDEEYLNKPKRWDVGNIKKFMLTFGPISSLFDFISFFALYLFFKNSPTGFQTGWFMESLATQTLVIHIIRTRKIPFIQSRASKYLILTSLAGVLVGWVIPFTPIGRIFSFSPLPVGVLSILIVVVVCYLATVEIVKRYAFKRSFIS